MGRGIAGKPDESWAIMGRSDHQEMWASLAQRHVPGSLNPGGTEERASMNYLLHCRGEPLSIRTENGERRVKHWKMRLAPQDGCPRTDAPRLHSGDVDSWVDRVKTHELDVRQLTVPPHSRIAVSDRHSHVLA